MKTGRARCQLVAARDPLSKAIAYFGGGDYSHCDAVMPNGNLLGARSDRIWDPKKLAWIPPGVQIRPPGYAADEWIRCVVFELAVTPEQEAKFYGYLRQQIGKPYDWRAIVGFICGRSWYRKGAFVCSELLCAAGERSKITSELVLTANRITPNDISILWSGLGATHQEMPCTA